MKAAASKSPIVVQDCTGGHAGRAMRERAERASARDSLPWRASRRLWPVAAAVACGSEAGLVPSDRRGPPCSCSAVAGQSSGVGALLLVPPLPPQPRTRHRRKRRAALAFATSAFATARGRHPSVHLPLSIATPRRPAPAYSRHGSDCERNPTCRRRRVAAVVPRRPGA